MLLQSFHDETCQLFPHIIPKNKSFESSEYTVYSPPKSTSKRTSISTYISLYRIVNVQRTSRISLPNDLSKCWNRNCANLQSWALRRPVQIPRSICSSVCYTKSRKNKIAHRFRIRELNRVALLQPVLDAEQNLAIAVPRRSRSMSRLS